MAHPIPGLWLLTIRYGVYLSFAFGAVYWRNWRKNRRESLARNWPTAEAVILSGSVAPVPKTSCFLATLQYTYFVAEYHTGTYLQQFSREIDADDFVRLIKNQRILIRYNPTHTETSVLEQSTLDHRTQLTPHTS